mgnify:CR=1 FL=1
MNKRRYSNRRRKNILRVFILLMTIIITVVMWRTIKIDVQVVRIWLSSERRRPSDVLHKTLQTYSKKILRMYSFCINLHP